MSENPEKEGNTAKEDEWQWSLRAYCGMPPRPNKEKQCPGREKVKTPSWALS